MKTILAVTVFALTLSALACGQNGFAPVFDKPVEFEQVHGTYAWVKGHWVGEHMVGPESSEISCDKAANTCTDSQANISVIGGMFGMSGFVTEYTITRWNKTRMCSSRVSTINRLP